MTTDATGAALILAAGRGTRMKSAMAKVLHPLLGRPMVRFPIDAARDAGLAPFVVVHHQEEQVRAALADQPDVTFARQEQTRGTGDAVRSALGVLPEDGVVVVLNGDGPLLTAATLRRLLDAHGDHLVTLLTVEMAEPGRYGRIVREGGQPVRIVEAAEATKEQLAITEVNAGIYAFDLAWLRTVLPALAPHPPKGEIYLTDTLELAAAAGRAQAIVVDDPDEVEGANDRWQLSRLRRVLQQRVIADIARSGVTFESPETTLVEAGVQIHRDAWIAPGVVLRGSTTIGEGARIGAHCVITDSFVGAGVTVKPHSVLEGATVDASQTTTVGPFARLRPAAVVRDGAKVGNFVEVKKSEIQAGAKVSHLTYIGDATVGEGANVGAGTITCNYDGYNKHRTEIGAGAFVGSNAALVAPVTIGEGAIVGAGSTITQDVPADALALGRVRQTNLSGRAEKLREQLAALKKQR